MVCEAAKDSTAVGRIKRSNFNVLYNFTYTTNYVTHIWGMYSSFFIISLFVFHSFRVAEYLHLHFVWLLYYDYHLFYYLSSLNSFFFFASLVVSVLYYVMLIRWHLNRIWMMLNRWVVDSDSDSMKFTARYQEVTPLPLQADMASKTTARIH